MVTMADILKDDLRKKITAILVQRDEKLDTGLQSRKK